MKELNKHKMAVMPIPRLILSMSLPAMLSMMVQAMYNIVDSLFVSRISEKALTAVSLAFPVQMVLVACFVGLGIGINSFVSRKLGEKDIESATSIAEHGYLLALILYGIVALGGFLFIDNFFILFTKDPVILKYSITYGRIILIFSFGRIFAQAGMSIMQGCGQMIIPMIAQLIGAISNIILDYIMIFGHFGFPAMGVKGAAIATVTAQGISMVFVFLMIFGGKQYLKLDLSKFKFNSQIAKGIILVGLPAAVMQGLVSFMLAGMNFILAAFGATSVAVLGIYYRLQSLIFMPVFGVSQGTMPVIGYNYGSKNKKRIISSLRFSSIITLGYMIIGLIIFQIFAGSFLNLFNSSEEMYAVGLVAFRRISLIFPFIGISVILSTAFQGMGKAYYSLIVSVLKQIIILLPLAWILGKFFGLDILWFSYLAAEIIGLIVSLFFFRSTYNHVLESWKT